MDTRRVSPARYWRSFTVVIFYERRVFFLLLFLCENFAMPADRRAAKILFVAVLATTALAISYAIYLNRPWHIPEEAERRPNPIPASPAALAAARSIYNDKCTNCHGDAGKGDGPDARSYYPQPSNLADPQNMNKLTDGEIFYQISEGRKPMPSFKKKLTEEQRWELVLLVRSFAASNVGASSAPAP
jgi:mono/diheme cytochrome c family protein